MPIDAERRQDSREIFLSFFLVLRLSAGGIKFDERELEETRLSRMRRNLDWLTSKRARTATGGGNELFRSNPRKLLAASSSPLEGSRIKKGSRLAAG